MAERTASITVWLDAASAGSSSATDAGTTRSGFTSAANASRSAADGQVPVEEQVPDVLERQLVGQLDGVVLAVVVEALEAADVADRGLGDDHALEPGRRLDGRRVHHGLDLRHAHERSQRHDADELVVRRPRGGGGSRARRTRGTPPAPTGRARRSRPAASSTR